MPWIHSFLCFGIHCMRQNSHIHISLQRFIHTMCYPMQDRYSNPEGRGYNILHRYIL